MSAFPKHTSENHFLNILRPFRRLLPNNLPGETGEPPSTYQFIMCTYYYLHYHHLAPCAREIEYAVQYAFCVNSTYTPAHHHHTRPLGNDEGQQGVQQPCEALTYAPECNPTEGIDYNDPCATGGCLVSQQCSSGGCRLEDLGGSWVCCQCARGGNTYRWCVHPMRKIPDALCYHAVCQNCRSDT
ncbi:hypothetical protein F5B20DRAFT_584102 [Whalleya microplaca]|nr:hypothetical protein F5B20DRAFT_584102 [Whalleya microplaca]